MHPLIERLSAELAPIVPQESVEIGGAWSTSPRRTYESPDQEGTGVGPFVEVVDVRWRGTLTCAVPLAGYAFMVTPGEASWVKSLPPAMNPDITVSMHAYADQRAERASFAASLVGTVTHSVVFACGPDLIASCTLGPTTTVTGRAHLVAEVEGAAFVTILLSRSVLKVGRNRLWRLLDEVASLLSAEVRGHFGRGRTGVLRPDHSDR